MGVKVYPKSHFPGAIIMRFYENKLSVRLKVYIIILL